jgi:hypothetical protein
MPDKSLHWLQAVIVTCFALTAMQAPTNGASELKS